MGHTETGCLGPTDPGLSAPVLDHMRVLGSASVLKAYLLRMQERFPQSQWQPWKH